MVAIMTDTNSGITVAEGKANGFYVLPMPVLVDNRCYMEGVDITHEELYGSLMANCSVHTSQPAPGSRRICGIASFQRVQMRLYISP